MDPSVGSGSSGGPPVGKGRGKGRFSRRRIWLIVVTLLAACAVSYPFVTDWLQHSLDDCARERGSWNCSGKDLSGADLTGRDLTGIDFTQANLVGANFERADLARANLVGADLSEANLIGADLSEANLTGADFYTDYARLSGADLTGANLKGLNLGNAKFRGTDLSGADLSGADLRKAWFDRGSGRWPADLTGANLQGANLHNALLADADLSGANLSGADLTSSTLGAGTCCSADLSGANLSGATLVRSYSDASCMADNRGDCEYSDYADLPGTDLSDVYNHIPGGANPVSGDHFESAELQQLRRERNRAVPGNPVLKPAGANLVGESIWWTDFRRVHADQTTIWPDGFDPIIAGVHFD